MAGKHGIDPNKPVEICMALECERKALYRNSRAQGPKATQRGYCKVHKDMAMAQLSERSIASRDYWFDHKPHGRD